MDALLARVIVPIGVLVHVQLRPGGSGAVDVSAEHHCKLWGSIG